MVILQSFSCTFVSSLFTEYRDQAWIYISYWIYGWTVAKETQKWKYGNHVNTAESGEENTDCNYIYRFVIWEQNEIGKT